MHLERFNVRGRTIAAAGFTLVEVVLVVAIVAVFAAIALPRFGNSTQRYRADLAARKLAADIEWCQMSARATGVSTTLTLATTGDTYTLSGVSTTGNTVGDLTVKLAEPPFSVAIGTVTLSKSGTAVRAVTFDRFGIPDASGTIVIQTNTASRTVSLGSPGGSVSVQ